MKIMPDTKLEPDRHLPSPDKFSSKEKSPDDVNKIMFRGKTIKI